MVAFFFLTLFTLYLEWLPSIYFRNVSIVGFGKAVLGMATELYRMIGHHVIRGVLSVPVGALSLSIDSTIFSSNNIIK